MFGTSILPPLPPAPLFLPLAHSLSLFHSLPHSLTPSLTRALAHSLTFLAHVRRWATEDPNPAAARAEHKRLVAEGEAGIARSLDPDFVQAVREMDEFEGKVEPRAPSPPPPQPEEEEQEEPRAKRARIEPPVEEKEEETKPQGLLSANAIDSLRYMASLRQQQTKTAPVVATKPVVNALGSLADYGSDEDSD